MAGGRTSLYERQWCEVDAIKSIYIDEYEELPHPWKVDHPPNFILHLKIVEVVGTAEIDVEFKMHAQYPEAAPEIIVRRQKGIQASQASTIQLKLCEKAKESLGKEMIFEIVEYARELLAGSVIKKVVSFHDEMIKRKSVADLKKFQTTNCAPSEATAAQRPTAEDEALTRRVHELLLIKEREATLLRRLEAEEPSQSQIVGFIETINLEPSIEIFLPDYVDPVRIAKVRVGEVITNASLPGVAYHALCVPEDDAFSEFIIVATCVQVEGSFYTSAHGHKKLQNLCKKVNEIGRIRYSPFYCRPLGAFLRDKDRCLELWILSEPTSGISLRNLLECSGGMNLAKAMSMLEQVLLALQELHLNNISHQDLTVGSIVISAPGSKVQIVNIGVTRYLRDTHQSHQLSLRIDLPEDISWRPPEVINRGGQGGKKADVWFAAHLFIQSLLGLEFPSQHEAFHEALEAIRTQLPETVYSMLREMIRTDPLARPLPGELLRHEAFSEASMEQYENVGWNMMITRPLKFHPQDKALEALRPQKEKNSNSRYRSDFEEIQFLGRGAFGEVIKARNRIDNRFYAIKRIRLDPLNVEENAKILREVTTLSRLHHDRVVRYYQAWIEDSFGKDRSPCQSRDGSRGLEGLGYDSFQSTDYDDISETDDDYDEKWSQEGISSRKLYANNTLRNSTNSLSSLLQFHTGFTSEESLDVTRLDTSNDLLSGDREGDPVKGSQYLYIQMEYCPNQTLREVIDMGLESEEAWRLFRQIAEGLNYLHSQGMIHRDLKPGNIFLDSNGDAKIGDFGLAVGEEVAKTQRMGSVFETPSEAFGESLTGGIGTPFYVSPEQETEGSRYNQKVDMYSLGIILLELLVPFKTGMERALTLKDARSPKIELPDSLKAGEMQKAFELLKILLDHDPGKRLTADELVHSDLLPAKMEDEYIMEAIRTIANVNGPNFKKLLNHVFAQTVDPLKAYTFDYNAGTVTDMAVLAGMSEANKYLVQLFRRHGAIRVDCPLLLPKGDKSALYPGPLVLLESGEIGEMPTSFVQSFARFVALNRIGDLRRFTIGHTFRENASGGHPRQVYEASFDIVQSDGDTLLPKLELIRLAIEAVSHILSESGGSLTLRLNHSDLLSGILAQSLVPSSKKEAFLMILAKGQNLTLPRLRTILSSKLGLPINSIESFGKMVGIKDFEAGEALKRLDELFHSIKEIRNALALLTALLTSIGSLGVKARVCIDPAFSLNPQIYHGLMFQVQVEDRKRMSTCAQGGDYGKLVDSCRLPTDRNGLTNASGVSFDLTLMSSLRWATGGKLKPEPAILLYSTGVDLFQEKLTVASLLWDAGFKVELVNDTVSTDQVSHIVRTRGIQFGIALKDHSSRGPYGLLKLKSFEKRQELDVPRTELVEALKALMSENSKGSGIQADPDTPTVSQPPLAPLNVSLFSPLTKIKGNQRNMIMDKAVRAMTPLLSSFAGTKPVEVIAHDIPRNLLRHIIDTVGDGEDVFRKAIESGERDAALKMRNLLKGLKDKNSLAFLFNYRDEQMELFSFLL